MTDRTTLDAWHVVAARGLEAGDVLMSSEWAVPRKVWSTAYPRLWLEDISGPRNTWHLLRLPADVRVQSKGEEEAA